MIFNKLVQKHTDVFLDYVILCYALVVFSIHLRALMNALIHGVTSSFCLVAG